MKISRPTLAYDIGLAGDDAWQFFGRFAKRFSIDAESFGGFDWVKQFRNEVDCAVPVWPGLLIFLPIIGWIMLYRMCKNWKREQHEKHKDDPKTVRVQDLIDATAAKRWIKKDHTASTETELLLHG